MVATIFVERITYEHTHTRPFTKSPLLATESPSAMLTVGAGEALMGPGLGVILNRVSGPLTHALRNAATGPGILHCRCRCKRDRTKCGEV
jgi:hypothetical protein